MSIKSVAVSAGIGAAAGMVAVMMMPRTNPTRKLAAKAANRMEDAVYKMTDAINEKIDSGL